MPYRCSFSRKPSLTDGNIHPNPWESFSNLKAKYAPPALPQHLKFQSQNLQKKLPLPFISHKIVQQYNIIAGQEINEKQGEIARQLSVLPSTPLVIAATSKDRLSGLPSAYYKHGALLAFSADLAPYASPFQLRHHRGILVSATVCLPNFPKFLVASVYAPEDPSLKHEPQVIIENLMQEHPLCIFTGDFKYTFQSLESDNVLHTPKWLWLSSSVYPSKPKLHDT